MINDLYIHRKRPHLDVTIINLFNIFVLQEIYSKKILVLLYTFEILKELFQLLGVVSLF